MNAKRTKLMKTKLAVTALVLSGVTGSAFAVDFTGPVAPGNWTVGNVGTLTGGSPALGTAVFSPTQLVLTGSNSLSPPPGGETPACAGGVFQTLGPCEVRATIGGLAGTYAFSWSYLSSDTAGPGGDLFGVIVNGTRTVLSDPGGAIAQSGSSSFSVASSFGWFINCTDCIGGSATATISNFAFTQAIPEPSTYGLMLAGLAALGAAVRRRREGRPSA